MQYLIVLLMLGVAVVYGVYLLRSSIGSFSSKNRCGHDCGCGATSKELILKD
jgi:hypothetical protein